MKFIRTDKNIFEVIDENAKVYYVKAKKDSNKVYSKSKNQTLVFKSSNYIDELCDLFVCETNTTKGVIRETNKHPQFDSKYPESEYYLGTKIYGGIWTTEGLKYVAQMNEKGEFDLL